MIDFILFGGFDEKLMDRKMGICTSRVAFVNENLSHTSLLSVRTVNCNSLQKGSQNT